MALNIGDQAPDFELLDQDGNPHRLSELRGKQVVIYFYPKAMTPGCTVQACGIRDSHAEFATANTVVFAISPDSSARLKKFEEKEKLNFRLLSDPEHQVAEAYGAWGQKKFMGREVIGILRSTYVIDVDGCVSGYMPKVNTKSHHTDVMKLLAK